MGLWDEVGPLSSEVAALRSGAEELGAGLGRKGTVPTSGPGSAGTGGVAPRVGRTADGRGRTVSACERAR